MKPIQNYTKNLGLLTLLAGILAFNCNILLAIGVNFNFDSFAQPALIFQDLQKCQVTYFRWGMIADIWGYYLLFIPAMLHFYDHIESPWRKVIVLSGLAYAIFGAIGAAILAATGTEALRDFLKATATDQALYKNNFLVVYSIVNNGIWNLLEMGLLGVFMLGIATLFRGQNKVLYGLTILLGVSGIIDSIGNTLELHWLAEIGLNLYLLFWPIWAIWIGLNWVCEHKGAMTPGPSHRIASMGG